jgi:hypothetical protein
MSLDQFHLNSNHSICNTSYDRKQYFGFLIPKEDKKPSPVTENNESYDSAIKDLFEALNSVRELMELRNEIKQYREKEEGK